MVVRKESLKWDGGEPHNSHNLHTVHITFVQVDDKTGRVTGSQKTYAICGFIRGMVRLPGVLESDASNDDSHYQSLCIVLPFSSLPDVSLS